MDDFRSLKNRSLLDYGFEISTWYHCSKSECGFCDSCEHSTLICIRLSTVLVDLDYICQHERMHFWMHFVYLEFLSTTTPRCAIVIITVTHVAISWSPSSFDDLLTQRWLLSNSECRIFRNLSWKNDFVMSSTSLSWVDHFCMFNRLLARRTSSAPCNSCVLVLCVGQSVIASCGSDSKRRSRFVAPLLLTSFALVRRRLYDQICRCITRQLNVWDYA